MPRLDDSVATSVYAVSVDSRSRPPEQPDNKYTISLNRTLDRVKSVQLGSIQIPDCRYAFDTSSILQYSEPLTILPDTHLFVQETVQTFDKVNNTASTTTRVIQLALPPTLNRIVNFVDTVGSDADVAVTEFDAGLDFGIKYYPTVNLDIKVIGAHFPPSLMTVPMPLPFPTEAGPVLAQTTVQQQTDGYYGPASPTESPDKSYQYAAGYLDALTSSAGNYPQRHVLFDGTPCLVAWSYVYAAKPTMVELFTMLNAALADQSRIGASSVTGTIVNVVAVGPDLLITTGAPHLLHSYDQVVISGVVGVAGANGTFFVTSVPSSTTFTITPSSVVGAYVSGGTFASPRGLTGLVQFGFDDENNLIQAIGPSIVRESRTSKVTTSYTLASAPNSSVVSLAAYLGFGTQSLEPPATAKVPEYIIRTIQLRQGNYNAVELSAALAVRWNPLSFGPNAASRTLNYVLPVGTPASLVIPQGRLTPSQMVDFLNASLNPAPAQISVSFNATTGRFLFRHLLGLQFGLNFAPVTSTLLALQFGFAPVSYTGSSSYVSPNRAVYGVPASAPLGVSTFPTNTYAIFPDETQSRYTFDTGNSPQLVVDTGVSDTTGCPYTVAWEPMYDCMSATTGISLPWQAGMVLNAKAPYFSGIVTNATNTTPITITTSVAHGLTNGDSVTISCVAGNTAANGTWTVASVAAFTFTLVNSVGNGTFPMGSTGNIVTNSVDPGTGFQVATNTYQVVVAAPIDYSTLAPYPVQLQPTVSIFSLLDAGTVNESLLQPTATRRILVQSAARDVFQLFFSHPSSKASNFGFPPISWPPSARALQTFHGPSLSTYNAAIQAVPVSNSYTAPFCWNLLPPDYILMLLCNPVGSKDAHTHAWRKKSTTVFAKLYITAPYLNIADQMQFSTFAGFQRVTQVSVEFQNPDGTLVEFNGRPHSYELLFTLYENSAETNCF